MNQTDNKILDQVVNQDHRDLHKVDNLHKRVNLHRVHRVVNLLKAVSHNKVAKAHLDQKVKVQMEFRLQEEAHNNQAHHHNQALNHLRVLNNQAHKLDHLLRKAARKVGGLDNQMANKGEEEVVEFYKQLLKKQLTYPRHLKQKWPL